MDTSTFREIHDLITKAEERTSISLTQYTKRTQVSLNAYIDETIVNEKATEDALLMSYQLFTGLLITSIQLSSYVQGSSIRNKLGVVATEDFREKEFIDLAQKINPKNAIVTNEKDTSELMEMQPKNADILPGGRVVKIVFNTESGKPLNLNLHLKINPYTMKRNVLEQFATVVQGSNWNQRYAQAKAGQISFFKDLLLQNDIIKKEVNALKNDDTGQYAELLRMQKRGRGNLLEKIFFLNDKANICKDILIYSEDTFKRALKSSSLNFKSYKDRNKFLTNTFCFMLILIDPNYNEAKVFLHGMEAIGRYPFELLAKCGKEGKFSIDDVAKAINQGSIPSFR